MTTLRARLRPLPVRPRRSCWACHAPFRAWAPLAREVPGLGFRPYCSEACLERDVAADWALILEASDAAAVEAQARPAHRSASY